MSQTIESFTETIPFPEYFEQRQSYELSIPLSHLAMPRPRRKSSGLGADIRGDTGAPAVSTLDPMPTINSPPLSPVSILAFQTRTRGSKRSILTGSEFSGLPNRRHPDRILSAGKPEVFYGDGKIFHFDIHGSTPSYSSSPSSPPIMSIQSRAIPFTAPSISHTHLLQMILQSHLVPAMILMRQDNTEKAPEISHSLRSTSSFSPLLANSSCSASFDPSPSTLISDLVPSNLDSWSRSTPPYISLLLDPLGFSSCLGLLFGILTQQPCLRIILTELTMPT